MNFSEALTAIIEGQTVLRKKWNNKVKVYLVKNKLNNINHIEVRSITNCMMYAASSEDLLANDWELLDSDIPSKQVSQEDIVL